MYRLSLFQSGEWVSFAHSVDDGPTPAEPPAISGTITGKNATPCRVPRLSCGVSLRLQPFFRRMRRLLAWRQA